jgi:hypothetical protein
MNPDPPIRKDGLCACGCGRKVDVKYHSKAAAAVRGPEPFATSNCCKAWHGVQTSGFSFSVERGKQGKKAA